jgi:hypothetical protein
MMQGKRREITNNSLKGMKEGERFQRLCVQGFSLTIERPRNAEGFDMTFMAAVPHNSEAYYLLAPYTVVLFRMLLVF